MRRLPDLNRGRYGHACGHYVENSNDVRITLYNTIELHCYINAKCNMYIQVYIVTGGYCNVCGSLSSTEVLTEGSSPQWNLIADLPSSLYATQGLSFDNSFFVFGEYQTA